MTMTAPFLCGFVPSLEALPVLAAGRSMEQRMQFKGCPGYGRIIRHLLTGDLEAGLLPWELFVSEVLGRPGQAGRWAVPLVVHACPVELVLSRTAHRLCYPAKPQDPGRTMRRLTFAIEGRRSLMRFQIASWLERIPGAARPLFKVLPMELMLKGLEAGMMDGIVAPAPWGQLAETAGCGRLDPLFDPGSYAQQVVLVCRQQICHSLPGFCQEFPAACAAARQAITVPAAFKAAAAWATASGWPQMTPELLFQSALRYGPLAQPAPPVDFAPDAVWLMAQWDKLVSLQVMAPGPHESHPALSLLPQSAGCHPEQATPNTVPVHF